MNGDLLVTCPKCGHGGHVPVRFAGHVIHCRHCDHHFPVPTRAAVPGSPAPATPTAAVTATASVTAPVGAPAVDDDDIPLVPLAEEEEKHCRERYEARVLSKDRSVNHDQDVKSSW
jgi:hypothetical protein